MSALLRLHGVTAFYGAIQALKGVDLEVNQGEIVTLIGSNGAGKSTLMMTICGNPRARDGESPLMRMQQRLHLSDSEVVVLTLLAGVELSPDIRAHVMTASGGAAAGVTRERIRCVVYGTAPSREAMRELGANGRLRKLGLIERCDSARDTGHESHHAWTLATRVLELLLGDDAPSESVPPVTRVSPIAVFSTVDLPEPLAPSTATISPALSESDRSFRTVIMP